MVDHAAHGQRQRQCCRGGEAEEEDGSGDLAAIAPEIREDAPQRRQRAPPVFRSAGVSAIVSSRNRASKSRGTALCLIFA